MKRSVALITVVLLAVGCSAEPHDTQRSITGPQPSFAVFTNERQPMTIVTASCGGEPVVFTGTMHVVQRMTVDGSGGSHSGFSLDAHLTGTGASGTEYLLNFNEMFQKNTTEASTQTFVSR